MRKLKTASQFFCCCLKKKWHRCKMLKADFQQSKLQPTIVFFSLHTGTWRWKQQGENKAGTCIWEEEITLHTSIKTTRPNCSHTTSKPPPVDCTSKQGQVLVVGRPSQQSMTPSRHPTKKKSLIINSHTQLPRTIFLVSAGYSVK